MSTDYSAFSEPCFGAAHFVMKSKKPLTLEGLSTYRV